MFVLDECTFWHWHHLVCIIENVYSLLCSGMSAVHVISSIPNRSCKPLQEGFHCFEGVPSKKIQVVQVGSIATEADL